MAARSVSGRGVSAACVAGAVVLLMVAWLYGAIWLVTSDVGTYTTVYESEGIYETAGVDEETLLMLTQDLIDYLQGSRAELDRQAVVDGVLRDAFLTRERQHMADVRALYAFGGRLAQGCSVAAVLLLLIAWQRLRCEKEARARLRTVGKGLLIGAGTFCALLAVLVVWAMIDFESLFLLFHHAAFSNDLWLLDPRTELLIRMMPTALFMRAAGRIALLVGTVVAALGFVGGLLMRRQASRA